MDVDDATRDVVLVVRWRGGQHSELRVRKPAAGEHTKRTSEDADRVIREMATRWSDEHIAATLNQMGFTTGHGHTWTHVRVGASRRKAGIHGCESAVKDGHCLTMLDAAKRLDVTCHAIRKLIREKILPARPVMFDAPWQITATDLDRPEVPDALRCRRPRQGRSCRNASDICTIVIPSI